VITGPLIGELRVILSGLQPEESVLVNGAMTLAFLPPGAQVAPEMKPMPEMRFPPATAPSASGPATTPATAPEGAK
jgi:hypothetical protein